MNPDQLADLLDEVADAVAAALGGHEDWGPSGTKVGQYRSDLAADAAALGVLAGAGVGVLSEESGRHRPDAAITVVVDPLDGSTNASRGIPWYATSLCAVDADGLRAALVVDQSSGARFEAVRGGGARVDGDTLAPSACTELAEAVVGLSGYPPHHLGWKQYRAFGAIALDLCAVAAGRLDAFIDCSPSAHGPWDYLGGMLICQEAGALVTDAEDRELVTTDHDARRTPIAAATAALLEEATRAQRGFARPGGPPS